MFVIRNKQGHCAQSAFTLVEVVVAMVLVTMMISGIYAGIMQGASMNYAAGQRIAAFGLCGDLIESMRGASYVEVNTNRFGAETVEISSWGGARTPITGERTVEIESFFFPPRKQVTVRLEWSYRGQELAETATGIIYFRGRRLTGSAGGVVSGELNVNPNNSPDGAFSLSMSDGTLITRDDFLDATFNGVSGNANEVYVQPKGGGVQNSLYLNGEPFPVSNGRGYLIQGSSMTVNLYNAHPGQGQGAGAGLGAGLWRLEISSADALITVD